MVSNVPTNLQLMAFRALLEMDSLGAAFFFDLNEDLKTYNYTLT